MIGYLKGRVIQIDEGLCTVLVGGVGYLVNLGPDASQKLIGLGEEEQEIWIHTYVREDQLTLFGFTSPMQKKMFLILVGVNGVGPKLAINIVNKLSAEEIVDSITMGNTKVLTSIPGIGKKMAERIVLELKGKFSAKLSQLQTASSSQPSSSSQIWRDLTDALQGLGFPDNKVLAVIRLIRQDPSSETISLDDALKLALQKINQC